MGNLRGSLLSLFSLSLHALCSPTPLCTVSKLLFHVLRRPAWGHHRHASDESEKEAAWFPGSSPKSSYWGLGNSKGTHCRWGRFCQKTVKIIDEVFLNRFIIFLEVAQDISELCWRGLSVLQMRTLVLFMPAHWLSPGLESPVASHPAASVALAQACTERAERGMSFSSSLHSYPWALCVLKKCFLHRGSVWKCETLLCAGGVNTGSGGGCSFEDAHLGKQAGWKLCPFSLTVQQ